MYVTENKVCSHCKKEMALTENDVLYGKNWYHKTCWDITQESLMHNS